MSSTLVPTTTTTTTTITTTSRRHRPSGPPRLNRDPDRPHRSIGDRRRKKSSCAGSSDVAVDRRSTAVVGRYVDDRTGSREIVALGGAHASILLVDRCVLDPGDCRLVAHLAAEEPAENTCLTCAIYLEDVVGRRCRALSPDDLRADPLRTDDRDGEGEIEAIRECDVRAGIPAHRLEMRAGQRSTSQLRWIRCEGTTRGVTGTVVSVRDVVATVQSYGCVRGATLGAIAEHGSDPGVSVAMIRAELARLDNSPIVLNRGLREATMRAVHVEGVSLSEIARRCGRVKRDAHGKTSGETSWLGRRIGLLAEGGKSVPTPWVHTDVLALIARRGLGIAPREVEVP